MLTEMACRGQARARAQCEHCFPALRPRLLVKPFVAAHFSYQRETWQATKVKQVVVQASLQPGAHCTVGLNVDRNGMQRPGQGPCSV